MVTTNKRSRRPRTPQWQTAFLAMLPAIQQHAKIAFRHLNPEAREEAVQEAVCNACCAVARLAELGKLDLAYPTVLARYAVAQVNDGRKVGCKLNIRDVLSPYCRRRKDVTVERLDHFDAEEGCWMEVLVEDRSAGPAEIASARIDFAAWLRSLPRRERKIATSLSMGESTTATAKMFGVSAGRISQLRKHFKHAWEAFIAEAPAAVAAT